MDKYYSQSNYNTAALHVTENSPIDDRLVINNQSGLFTSWGSLQYDGMRVSVVSDEISANNGLYLLMNKDKYDKQSWDSSAVNYDIAGWRRIDGYAENITGVNGGEIPQTGNLIHN